VIREDRLGLVRASRPPGEGGRRPRGFGGLRRLAGGPARPLPRALTALLATSLLAGCFEYSPHELPTDSADRDVHRKSVEALASAPPPVPLRFAVVGDTQQRFDHARDFVAAVNQRDDLALVVQVGDFTHFGLTFEYEVMNRQFRALRVPYFVVVGAHDLFGNGRAVYEHMFGPIDFAFTHGRVRLVLLNTNGRDFAFAPDVPDLAWLATQLAPDDEHDAAIVFGHVAPNGGDFTPSLREAYPALLRDAGVTLSVHGHGHRFELWEEDGVTFVVADSVDHRDYLVITARPDGGYDVERVSF
jgi:predicted phosphodiesterase